MSGTRGTPILRMRAGSAGPQSAGAQSANAQPAGSTISQQFSRRMGSRPVMINPQSRGIMAVIRRAQERAAAQNADE
jgi:hypothetical protein